MTMRMPVAPCRDSNVAVISLASWSALFCQHMSVDIEPMLGADIVTQGRTLVEQEDRALAQAIKLRIKAVQELVARPDECEVEKLSASVSWRIRGESSQRG